MRGKRKILFIVFFIAIGLRVVLGYLAREANDNHVEIVSWIADKHQLPGKSDCWECFQPKFYYILAAGMVNILDLHSTEHRQIALQFFNVLLSSFLLLIFWKFIQKQSINERAKIMWFSFFAFNPCLIGINVQATNDTLEIFSGVMTIYFCDMFFRNKTLLNYSVMLISLIIAAFTKATGLLLFIAICIFSIIKILSESNHSQKILYIKYFLIGSFCFIAVVPFEGGYYSYYKQYHSLPSCSWDKATSPLLLFKDTYSGRPGITSIADGYFTFRYFDMIRQPYITNGYDQDYSLHRTSLWSQLYGRTVFLQFDQWPPAWQTHAPLIIFVGRALIILGLVPLLLFLWGLFRGSMEFLRNIFKKKRTYFAESNNYLHIGITIALLAAVVKYSYDYRDFSTMKSIYLFPGFICYIKIFLDGYSSVKSLVLIKVTNVVIILMIAFSIASVSHLIYQLQYRF